MVQTNSLRARAHAPGASPPPPTQQFFFPAQYCLTFLSCGSFGRLVEYFPSNSRLNRDLPWPLKWFHSSKAPSSRWEETPAGRATPSRDSSHGTSVPPSCPDMYLARLTLHTMFKTLSFHLVLVG